MPNSKEALKQRPTRFRSPVCRGFAAGSGPIVRDGGRAGSGLIPNVAVITVGEALGHEMWIDDLFVQQVSAALASQPKGVKSRFTHPGMCSDGLGKYLGRAISNGSAIADGKTFCDIHVSKISRTSPQGDLGGYVMDYAEEDPESFGMSIVFDHDDLSEVEFIEANGGVWDSEYRCWVGFRSPDPLNVNHYPHCRLKKLWAVDVVDDPAANPGGMFHRGQDAPTAAESLLSYCLGLTDERPSQSVFDVDPERLSVFVTRFLDRHGLKILDKEGATMPLKNPLKGKGKFNTNGEEKPKEEETTQAEGKSSGEEASGTEADKTAEGQVPPVVEEEGDDPIDENKPKEDEEGDGKMSSAKKFQKAFGVEKGSVYFANGLTFAQAQAEFSKDQAKLNESLAAENEKLKQQLAAAKGEESPVEFDGGESKSADAKYTGKIGKKLSRFATEIDGKLGKKKR